jgi:mannose-6-phosphate isomerase
MTRLSGSVPKGWGNELIFASTDKYCGKLLNFNKDAKCSMHYHAEKDESWYVLSGKFQVNYIMTQDGSMRSDILSADEVWHNQPHEPHQLICLEAGTIIEVSTPDSVEDNYRIIPGDSQ